MSIQKHTYRNIIDCNARLKKLEVSITNNTFSAQSINLFAFSIQNVVNEYPLLTFSNSEDYDFLVQDLENNPIKATKILFVSTTLGVAGQDQLTKPVSVLKKDSDGTEDIYYQLPITKVQTQQRQGNRVKVEFDELILDGLTQFNQYEIEPSYTISLILYYRQLKRICLLDNPHLFTEKKPITDKIVERVKDIMCKREDSFKRKDPEDICTKNKKVFSLTLTNTDSNPQNITLFDSGITLASNTKTYGSPIFSTILDNETPQIDGQSINVYIESQNTVTFQSTQNATTNDIVTHNYTTNQTYRLQIAGTWFINGLALNTSLGNVIAGISTLNQLYIFNIPENSAPTIIHSDVVGGGSRGFGFYSPTSNVYVFVSRLVANVLVVDANSPYTNGLTPLTAGLYESINSEYCPTNDTVWVVNSLNPEIYIVDCGHLIVVTISMTVFLPVGETSIKAITYNSDTDQIIVCSENYAYTFNPTDIVPSSITALDVGLPDCGQLVYIPNVNRYGFMEDAFFSDAYFLNTDFIIQSIDTTIGGEPQPSFNGFRSSNDSLYMRTRGLEGISQFDFDPIEGAISFGDVDSYNFFNQGLRQDNKKVSCVKVVSSNQSQLVNNFDVLKIDANGKQNQEQISPIVKVNTFQQQGDRALIITDDLILDGQTQFSQYLLNGNQSVNLLVYYSEVKRSDFLTGKKNPFIKPIKVKPVDWVALAEKYNKDKIKAIEKCKELQIQITNTTATDTPFSLFQAFENQLITNTPSATFGDIDGYNFLVQNLRTNHLIFCGVEIVSTNQEQLNVPVIVSTDDADGDSVVYQHFPVNNLDTYQAQGNTVFIETNNLILDGLTTFPSYIIKANSTVTFVIFYRQFMLSSFFDIGFFKMKKPILDNGKGFANEMEYFNEVSTVSNNQINYKDKLNSEKNANKKEKNSIFDTEQSVSSFNSDYIPKGFDYLIPFYKKVRVKYERTNGVCKTDEPVKQKIYVPSENLDFGNKEFYQKQKVSDNPLDGFSSEVRTVNDLSSRETQLRSFYDPNNEEANRTKYRAFTKRKHRYKKKKLKKDRVNVKRNYRW